MIKKNNNTSILCDHLESTYLDNEMCFNSSLFHKDMHYRGEFGHALGRASMKTHAKEWLSLFQISDIEIVDQRINGDMVICDYVEIAKQLKPFKTIEPSSRALRIKNSVALGLADGKLTHYCLVKEIQDLLFQMLDHEEDKYKEVEHLPFFTTPHQTHMKVISEHLNENGIALTINQIKYLCGYFIGATDSDSQIFLGLPNLGTDNFKADIQMLFGTSNEDEVRRTLRDLNLAELLVEGFTLLKYPSIKGYDANKPCFGQKMHLTDNSKYLL